MFIIKRHLVDFNVDLEFDGSEVKMKDGERVLDSHQANGVRTALNKMKEIEEELHLLCQAMC